MLPTYVSGAGLPNVKQLKKKKLFSEQKSKKLKNLKNGAKSFYCQTCKKTKRSFWLRSSPGVAGKTWIKKFFKSQVDKMRRKKGKIVDFRSVDIEFKLR